MLIDLENAVKVWFGNQKISLATLGDILKKANVQHERWYGHGNVKSIKDLRNNLCGHKALLVPCNHFSLALVEFILVLDVQWPVTEKTTLHLYERFRHQRGWKKSVNTAYHQQFDNIAVRMQVDETPRAAAERCLYDKPKFKPNDVIFSTDGPKMLDSMTVPSQRYPGLNEVQRRILMKCALANPKETYKPQHIIPRKKGIVTSVFEWQPRAVEL